MEVICKKPVPMYESTCPECGSVFRYSKSEISFTLHVNCPVCGLAMWANTIMPVTENTDVVTWIPVSDHLPDKNGEYLVTLLSSTDGSRSLDIAYFDSRNPENQGFYKASKVIAWMSLPDIWRDGYTDDGIDQ